MSYQLHYWPTIQGRGEFVRLALETAQAPYVDVARGGKREGGGAEKLQQLLDDPALTRPPFACPVLVDGSHVVAQTALILHYLGPKLKLVGRSEADRLWAHQIQLTIADAVMEAHNTHHPVGVAKTYQAQKAPAALAAKEFRTQRIAKFLGWLESILSRNPTGPRHLVGARLSYVDLSAFQLVDGLLYAFPNATRKALHGTPHLLALHMAVALLPPLRAYLDSARRIPFNEEGIFRHYPELDD